MGFDSYKRSAPTEIIVAAEYAYGIKEELANAKKVDNESVSDLKPRLGQKAVTISPAASGQQLFNVSKTSQQINNQQPASSQASQTGLQPSSQRTALQKVSPQQKTDQNPQFPASSESMPVSELKIDLSSENILNAVIMSEVLGRPRCMRKGRWIR